MTPEKLSAIASQVDGAKKILDRITKLKKFVARLSGTEKLHMGLGNDGYFADREHLVEVDDLVMGHIRTMLIDDYQKQIAEAEAEFAALSVSE